MNDNPVTILIYVAIAGYVLHLYREDYRAARGGEPNPTALPGATSFTRGAFLIGGIGALCLLGIETAGEIVLGIAGEQSDMVWYFLFAILAAGVIEEVIFRGFLVIENKGRGPLVASCVGFSLIFALIHGYFWDMGGEDGFAWTFTTKAWFSTGLLFLNSLWFYAVRFGPWNPGRSLFPCFFAHALSNLGVFCVKLAQGHVVA